MKQCHSPPPKLYYLGSRNGKGPVEASNTRKLPDTDDRILCMDFAKDHLKSRGGNSPFISLFSSISNLHMYRSAHGEDQRHTAKMVLCEVDTSKLKGVELYRVRDIAPVMGDAAGEPPLPDFLALHRIPHEAIESLPLSILF